MYLHNIIMIANVFFRRKVARYFPTIGYNEFDMLLDNAHASFIMLILLF